MYYQIMPPLSDAEFAELKADIAERGVMVPVEYDENENILDGYHRVRACKELGIKNWPRITRTGLDEAAKRLHARQLNILRRHLTRDQKRELIASQLQDTPQRTDRQIAAGLGVDHKTVGAVRAEHSNGETPHKNRTEKSGRKARGRKPKDKPATKPKRKPAEAKPTPRPEPVISQPQKEIGQFHLEAVEFFASYERRFKEWHSTGPLIDEGGKECLLQAFQICAEGFSELMRYINGETEHNHACSNV